MKELSKCKEMKEFTLDEKLIIIEYLEELSRCGDFENIYPRNKQTIKAYSKYFGCQRSANYVIFKYLNMSPEA
jgi:hypothetical protein